MACQITVQHLLDISGRSRPTLPIDGLVRYLNATCPAYGIDTPEQCAHFLAQACHETDRFATLSEYASGEAYEGRGDLGNVEEGDGPRFKGRGIFQTTGRANYRRLGQVRGEPDLFLAAPELLQQPEYAVWSACEYWKEHGLGAIAARPDGDRLMRRLRRGGPPVALSPVEYISVVINGGTNGLEQRKLFYQRARTALAQAAAPAEAAGQA